MILRFWGCGMIATLQVLLAVGQQVDALPATSGQVIKDGQPAPSQAVAPVVDVKIDRILRDAYRDAFLIGMAGDLPERYSEEELQLAATHFNAITPENCMKPERIHSQEANWQFERADALVAWAEKHG